MESIPLNSTLHKPNRAGNVILNSLYHFVDHFITAFIIDRTTRIYKQKDSFQIPSVLIQIIYGYIDEQKTMIELVNAFELSLTRSKDVVNEIWKPTKMSGWSEDMEVFIEYAKEKTMNKSSITHIDDETFISKLSTENIICVSSTNDDCVAILTTRNLYLTQSIGNYPIWVEFKQLSKIDELISDYNATIDEQIATQITRNLGLDFIAHIIHIIPNLIGLSKTTILTNVLFSTTIIPSLHALFGIPIISSEPNQLVLKMYATQIRFQPINPYLTFKCCDHEHDNLCKVIDLHMQQITHYPKNNCLMLCNGINLTLKSKDEYSEWNGHIDALMNGSVIVKQGFLQKEGKRIKSWKTRWFRLYSCGTMSYYKNKYDRKPISSFYCKNVTKIECKSWSKTNTKRYGVELFTSERDWKFVCQNNDERQEWIKAFKYVKQL